MSDERLPVERRDHGLVFDPGRASPLVRRGLARLAVQAAALTNTGGAWSLLWSRDLKKRSSVAFPIPEILIEAGTIYAAIPEGLAAIDARSGAERWRVNIVHGSFDALPGEFGERGWAVMGGLLFYPDRDRGLCAVDCTTGAHRWCTGRQWKERPMAVATDQSIVYTSVDDPANDPDAYVCALDASTGNAVWCQKVRIELPDEDTTVQENVVRVVGQLALVRDVNRRIHAVDATSRTVRWYTAGSYALPRLIDGDLAFALGGTWPDEEPSYLAALDLATGQERWRFEAPKGQLSLAHDDIVDGTVHVISWRFGAKKERPFLHALDARTGTFRWEQELPFGIESSGAPNWVTGKHIDGYHEQVSTTRSAEPIYIRGDTGVRRALDRVIQTSQRSSRSTPQTEKCGGKLDHYRAEGGRHPGPGLEKLPPTPRTLDVYFRSTLKQGGCAGFSTASPVAFAGESMSSTRRRTWSSSCAATEVCTRWTPRPARFATSLLSHHRHRLRNYCGRCYSTSSA